MTYIAEIIKGYQYEVRMETVNISGQSLRGGDSSFTMERKQGSRYSFPTQKRRKCWIEQANKEAGETVAIAVD